MPTFASIAPYSFFLFSLACICLYNGYQSFIFYKRTRDLSYLPLSLFPIVGGVHLIILLFAIISYTYFKDPQILLILAILARIFLYAGMLSFVQFPVLAKSSILYKYRTAVTISIIIMIGIFSFLQFQTSAEPFVSDRGFIVENIQSSLATLLMILIPGCIALVEIISFLKIIPPQATSFFKIRVYFLSLGLLLAFIGNSLYILSYEPEQAVVGVALVTLGYICTGLGISIPNIRKFFLLRKN